MRIPPARTVGVLISGRGSNLVALLEARERGELDADFGVVISNKASAGGLVRAEALGVPTAVVDHKAFVSRADFEEALLAVLEEHGVELVVLAGFMRVLTSRFLSAYPNRILNVHPSLLPAFPGVDAQKQAFDYGVRVSGVTVHLVDEGTDTGPIVEQAVVPVLPDDDRDSLAARILVQEHRLLPRALGWLLAGRVEVRDRSARVHDLE